MAEGLAWEWTTDQEAGLVYLAVAAREHCGQQQSPCMDGIESDDESSYDGHGFAAEDDHEPIGSTTRPSDILEPVASSGDRMRKDFLDNFAELLACRKDAAHISGCVIVELEKKVKIFVARNSGFNPDTLAVDEKFPDRTFFAEFKQKIIDLCKGSFCKH